MMNEKEEDEKNYMLNKEKKRKEKWNYNNWNDEGNLCENRTKVKENFS